MTVSLKVKEQQQLTAEIVRVPASIKPETPKKEQVPAESEPDQPLNIETAPKKDMETEQQIKDLTQKIEQLDQKITQLPPPVSNDPLSDLKRRALELIIKRLEFET